MPNFTDLSGIRGPTVTLDAADFEVSDILTEFLTDQKTRPLRNEISTAFTVSKVLRLNGQTQTYQLQTPFLRTFQDTALNLWCLEPDSAGLVV